MFSAYNFKMEKGKFIFELKRKLIHLLSLLFVVIYILLKRYFGHKIGLMGLVFILIVFLWLDYFRVVLGKRIPFFHIFYRDEEKEILGGNVYFIVGTIIAFAVFDFRIALAALLMTTFGDMAAALFGVSLGRRKLYKKKSWAGTIAGFVVNLIIGFILLTNIYVIVLMAFVASLVELFFPHVDDNLAIPVFAGFVGEVLRIVI